MMQRSIRFFGVWELVRLDTGEKVYVHGKTGETVEDPPEEVLAILMSENSQKRKPVYEATPYRFKPFISLPELAGQGGGGEGDEKEEEEQEEAEAVSCDCCGGTGVVPTYGACPLCDGLGVLAWEGDQGAAAAAAARRRVRRVDLLGTSDGTAFQLHNFLAPAECEEVVGQAEAFGFKDCGYSKSIRRTDRVVVVGEPLAEALFSRLRPHLGDVEVGRGAGIKPGSWSPVGLNPCFRVCKYAPGGFFLPHHDANHMEDSEHRSLKTCMLYLNGGYEGGATTFYEETQRHYRSPDPGKVRHVLVPERGLCVIFDHCLTHDGGELLDGVKYILRSEVMYRRVRPL